jgi:PadR family transcriptional regulator AphA
MHYPGDRPLSLPEWLVLCIVYEQPTYGFAVAGLLSRDGRLGRIWPVSKAAIYRAVLRLERLGLVQVAGQQHTGQRPDRLLVTATQPGRRAARGWLRQPVAHGRGVQPELLLKLALLDRAGSDPRELLREQRAQFGPLAVALASQVEATTGIEHTLALWRYQTMSAAMQFLDDVAQQAELASAVRSNGHHRSRDRPASEPCSAATPCPPPNR